MNNFQKKCIEMVLKILNQQGFSDIQFEEVGTSEKYYLAKLRKNGHSYEIYIYDNEAGIMIDDKWFICEHPDSKSEEELIQKFLHILSDKLSKSEA